MKSIIGKKSGKKIVIGGGFFSYNGTTQYYITRLNSNGTLDTGFTTGAGFDNTIYAIAVQSDGKIVIGGDFYSYNGTSQDGITRLNSNGTRDTSFNIGTGFDGYVSAIAIQPDGKIIVGGNFYYYNGELQFCITRLNSDGTCDFQLGGFGRGYDPPLLVPAIAIQPDGKIIVGGNFTSYNTFTTRHGITRINPDGTNDTSFNPFGAFYNGVGTNTVFAIAVQSDGKIVVGGNFTSYDGTTQNRITRLNSNGTRDTSFNIGTGFDGSVNTIAVQSDGKILVGGQFTSYNGTTQNRITTLNSDGTRDTSFVIGTGFNSSVNTIAIQSDSKIIIGGSFTSYNGTTQNRITRLNSNGVLDTEFTIGTGTNNTVTAISIT